MADEITIHLSLTSSPSTPRVAISVPPAATAADLRKLASESTRVPLSSLKLIYRGRMIPAKEGGNVVSEMKLEDGCVVHVMGKPAAAGGGSDGAAAPAAAGTAPAGATVSLGPAAAAPASSSATTVTAALARLAISGGDTYRTALTTADKVLGNIVKNPMEEKYRSVKRSNAAFQRRLGGVPGGHEFMLAAGFALTTKDGEEYYVLEASESKWTGLVAAKEKVAGVLAEVNRTGGAAAAAGAGAAAPAPGAFGGAGGLGAGGAFPPMPGGMPSMPGGMPSPDQMAQVQSMMRDPQAMAQMLGDPMVQQMMQSDPRLANNPMLQQFMNNPQMMERAMAAMSDPNMMNRMSQMMAGAGGGTAGGTGQASDPAEMQRQMRQWQQMSQAFGGTSGGAGAAGTGGAGGNSGSNGGGASGNDSEMTEEEMIEEAIRRSMQDQS